MKKHRWSGWPGAFCLDCFEPDPAEICIAVHDRLDYVCRKCGEHWPQDYCTSGGFHDVEEIPCPDHRTGECSVG